ncbi:MAG: hypothetical protein LBV74_03720 [Tannerella sp.]|nr:hypothetical protein [Tannerella sp.]
MTGRRDVSTPPSAPCDTVMSSPITTAGSPVTTKTFSRMRFGNWRISYPAKNVDNKKVLPLLRKSQLINEYESPGIKK